MKTQNRDNNQIGVVGHRVARRRSRSHRDVFSLPDDPRLRCEVLVHLVNDYVNTCPAIHPPIEEINAILQKFLRDAGYLREGRAKSKFRSYHVSKNDKVTTKVTTKVSTKVSTNVPLGGKNVNSTPMLAIIQEQLEQNGFPAKEVEQTQLRDAVLETSFRRRQSLLADSYSAPEVAKLLGTSRQTPLNRVTKGDLLAILENGRHLFPVWQFDPHAQGGILPGLPAVLHALKLSPVEKLYWLCQPSPYLEGRTPVQALKAGETERVISIARGVGE